ncbi:MAG: hypothetical protein AAF664_22940 [Planctomycetota bacterium]
MKYDDLMSVQTCARVYAPMMRIAAISGFMCLGVGTAAAQQPNDLFSALEEKRESNQSAPDQRPSLPNPFRDNRPSGALPSPGGGMQGLPGGFGALGGGNGDGFDQQDPTQAAPDMRRILEGEQQQIQRDPPPPIEVVGKVIGSRGIGKALLRVNGRFYLVEKGTRFSLPSNLEPRLYTVTSIDVKGVEIEGGEPKAVQRLQ